MPSGGALDDGQEQNDGHTRALDLEAQAKAAEQNNCFSV